LENCYTSTRLLRSLHRDYDPIRFVGKLTVQLTKPSTRAGHNLAIVNQIDSAALGCLALDLKPAQTDSAARNQLASAYVRKIECRAGYM